MYVKRKIELLAPGGDTDSIKAAILAGADAVYCGLNKFNARNRASNISFDDLQGILHLAHKHSCMVFLTLNIVIVETEFPALIALLNRLVNTSIDGIIVQDLGLFFLLSKYFKSLKIHASTQLTTHNEGQILFLNKLNASRVNLSRELNISEIKDLTLVAHQHGILTEVFVHGSYCISFSGICYLSSVHGGNSGNRGRCSQPCRDRYLTTSAGKDYPLNLKDNSAWSDLRELSDAGVDSLKIEGRIKSSDYVYTVVINWIQKLQYFDSQDERLKDNVELYKVFNRDFSNGFLRGTIQKGMFIDNPRDHSIQHLSEINSYASAAELELAHLKFYAEKEDLKAFLENELQQISLAKEPLTVDISGENGSPLKVTVRTSDRSFYVFSDVNLDIKGTEPLNYKIVFNRLKAINETEYFIAEFVIKNLRSGVYLPFKELTLIKRKILFNLNGSKEFVDPVVVPYPEKSHRTVIKPSLSVLISSIKDLHLLGECYADVFYQLPESFGIELSGLISLFLENRLLYPWFPSVLIGEDYTAALEFLKLVNPDLIVTNNTGIGYEAYKMGIKWIAGPFLNIVNSFSLLTLKENFNCYGAFISNELSRSQIHGISPPEGFKLYYSIYHPVVLMTSRQCLFHQVTGCENNEITDFCIQNCEKSSSITNLKGESFIIHKTKGNYHNLINEINFLNTAVVTDEPKLFTGFMIDLREIKTKIQNEIDKSLLIQLFNSFLNGDQGARDELEQMIQPTTSTQYLKGI